MHLHTGIHPAQYQVFRLRQSKMSCTRLPISISR